MHNFFSGTFGDVRFFEIGRTARFQLVSDSFKSDLNSKQFFFGGLNDTSEHIVCAGRIRVFQI